MPVTIQTLPKMQGFIEKNKNVIPIDCIDRALIEYYANESIKVNKYIIGALGVEIAMIAAIFLNKQDNANEAMGDLDLLQGYFKSREAMELDLQDKYQIDKNENVWFAYPLKKICHDTAFSKQEVKEALKALKQMGFIEHTREIRINTEQDWYTVHFDAYPGMIVYSAWQLGIGCDDEKEGEKNEEKENN